MVVQDFITKEQAAGLYSYIQENKVDDRRSNYKTLGIDPFTVLDDELCPEWDPEHLLIKTADYAYNFFKSYYNLDESFALDRVFGNIMLESAKLDTHKDFSYDESSEHDPTKKTFVAGLFLNSDYEGGEMDFLENKAVILKPQTGTLVLFNGHATWHGVAEVLSNNRTNILYMFYYTDKDQ